MWELNYYTGDGNIYTMPVKYIDIEIMSVETMAMGQVITRVERRKAVSDHKP